MYISFHTKVHLFILCLPGRNGNDFLRARLGWACCQAPVRVLATNDHGAACNRLGPNGSRLPITPLMVTGLAVVPVLIDCYIKWKHMPLFCADCLQRISSESKRFHILHYSNKICQASKLCLHQARTSGKQQPNIYLYLAVTIRRRILEPQEGTVPPWLRTASLQAGSTLQRKVEQMINSVAYEKL